jgi:hypothetical protein
MVCKNCGSNLENEKFCGNCGAPVDAPETAKPGNGKSIASMVLGIVSMAGSLGFLPSFPLMISLACGIVAVVLGKQEQPKNNTMALVGRILGWMGIGFSAYSFIASVLAIMLVILFYVVYFAIFIGVMSSTSAPVMF